MVENSSQERLHATVHGRVQGVGFRAYTYNSAKRIGLHGWVRNRFNGTVETVAEGERHQLELFLRDLRRGPGPSSVTRIDPDWLEATGEFSKFEVRWSA